MTRRELLGYVGAVLFAGGGWAAGRTPLRTPRSERRALARLLHGPSATVLGRRYLAAYPQAATPERLRADAGLSTLPPAMCADIEALRRTVLARQREDFEIGNTVQLDGWILARSEAALCALISLS